MGERARVDRGRPKLGFELRSRAGRTSLGSSGGRHRWLSAYGFAANADTGNVQKISDQVAGHRMGVLEWIIIALIAVSIVLPFLTGITGH
jgi:hypothetical protein